MKKRIRQRLHITLEPTTLVDIDQLKKSLNRSQYLEHLVRMARARADLEHLLYEEKRIETFIRTHGRDAGTTEELVNTKKLRGAAYDNWMAMLEGK